MLKLIWFTKGISQLIFSILVQPCLALVAAGYYLLLFFHLYVDLVVICQNFSFSPASAPLLLHQLLLMFLLRLCYHVLFEVVHGRREQTLSGFWIDATEEHTSQLSLVPHHFVIFLDRI